MGEHKANVAAIGDIYAGLMKLHSITRLVPYEISEDETFIVPALCYNPVNDTPAGTCGEKCDDHKCEANRTHIPIGSDVAGFHRIERCALFDQRAAYLRAVLVVPLHPRLPALPVAVHPTCLRFDSEWIRRSWERLDSFCAVELCPSLGPVPQGHGADGAAPLFKAMKEQMEVAPGPGRFSLVAPGLVITGELMTIDGKEYVRNLHPRHNLSKLFSVLDKPAKDSHLGRFAASLFDFQATARLAEEHEDKHGAIKRFLDRRDAQSKTGPSVLVARKMLDCMTKAVSGQYGPKQPFEGSLAYGQLLCRFIQIFFRRKQTGLDRARHAGYFLGLVRRARWHIVETKGLTLASNFLTAQTYAHSTQAAQVAVLKLMNLNARSAGPPSCFLLAS